MNGKLGGSVAAAVMMAAVAVMPGMAGAASTSDRLDSLERKLESRGLIEMLNRVE